VAGKGLDRQEGMERLRCGVGRSYVYSTYIASWIPAPGLASNLDHSGDGVPVGAAFSRFVKTVLERVEP
jgi:hypothetical protein